MADSSNFPAGLKRSAAMIVLKHREHFLLLRRAKPPFAGHYLPVGGKLEPFEDPYSAALRELKEETGLCPERLHFGGILTETSPTAYNWQSHIYWAEIGWIAPPACPEGVLEWISFDRLGHIPTPPTDLLIYQYLRAGKPFVFNALYDASMCMYWMSEEIEGKKVW
jgi:8-oxo-dGTP diphosphatase